MGDSSLLVNGDRHTAGVFNFLHVRNVNVYPLLMWIFIGLFTALPILPFLPGSTKLSVRWILPRGNPVPGIFSFLTPLLLPGSFCERCAICYAPLSHKFASERCLSLINCAGFLSHTHTLSRTLTHTLILPPCSTSHSIAHLTHNLMIKTCSTLLQHDCYNDRLSVCSVLLSHRVLDV